MKNFLVTLLITLACLGTAQNVCAQSVAPDNLQFGVGVPPDVEQITQKALNYLVSSQNENGSWDGGYDSHARGRENCGLAGLAIMAMLSTGEDPNSGPYANSIRSALRYLIRTQNPETGFLPNTMYNHGFAMLALTEAYGAIDETLIWEGEEVDDSRRRSLGEAVKLAVQLAVNSQRQNSSSAWRYSPTAQDADTSVTGAVLVGLLAARNAGVAVPEESLENALNYMQQMTGRKSGVTLYNTSVGSVSSGSSMSAIGALTLTIGQRSDSRQLAAATNRIKEFVELTDQRFPFYNTYYMAQALFQTDYESWERWNKITIRRLRRQQNKDGSFDSQQSKAYGTSMACLSLALNYRLLPIYER